MSQELSRSPEIHALTGIPALAAVWMVLYHMHAELEDASPLFWRMFSPILSVGYLGVDLFFILSGFIITYNYSTRLIPFRLPG